MIPPLSSDIVERYEELRNHLVQGHWSQASGWQIIVQHGLLAWSQLPPSRPLPSTSPPPPCTSDVPADVQLPVTQVLTSMVLHLHPEVAHVN